MDYPIQVNYEYTNNLYKAKRWLEKLPNLFAADFETASKFTLKDKELFDFRLKNFKLSFEEQRVLLQNITSSGLSHPSLTVITHLSIAWSDRNGFVVVCDSPTIRNLVYNFLINTDKTQMWHNNLFDYRHIFYHTNQLPKNSIDTMLLSKCLLNNADSFKDRVGLKELMGYAYGDWAISKENFILEEMWNINTIKYSAIDSCATYKLYEDIKEELNKWKI